MIYNDAYFGEGFEVQPVQIPQQQIPQQQQQPGINPLQAYQAYQTFAGGGAAGGAGGAAGAGGAGSAAGGSGGAMSALASNPIGWIAAAALAQNVAHNKGISSWQAGLKGQGGANIGEHFMDQWGVDKDSKARDVAGVLGWGRGGGILNPSYLPTKLFGRTK